MPGYRGVEKGADGQGSGAQAVLRAFEILNTLTDCERGLGLSDIVARSGVSMATAHRLLKTLEADGYIRQYQDRTYSLGPRLIELGRTASTLLPEWADQYLQELVEQTGETANLAVLDADEVVYVAQVRSQMTLQLATPIGARLPAHCTAVGKALLSSLPDAYIESVLRRTGMAPRTGHTITEPEELLRQVAQVRRTGYAVDIGEQEEGVSCIAVPVRPAPRNLAVSVSGPTERVTGDRHVRLAEMLSVAANRIVQELRQGNETFDDRSTASALARRGRRKVLGG